ncbi:transcription-repair coupling factor [Pseudogulbenkiania sp. NH8B]|uniref:transcription-repair coupling factor n=1 Tax=Pseudogulbenkiania sp. (strain NH8B) TaxID=748280 RepID=UPI00022797FB|nr:transcription-repair coupling factor [Pseudogulbenkiania sp. NH8B]BAK75589.1 transcription-repair coupling factor [Pseudogulbenkiania sp. NH8B]
MLTTPPPLPPAGQKTRLAPLPEGLDAALFARLAGQGRLVLVLAADAQSAQRLKAEIPFFAPDCRVALLPDWETLPYDHFSPHADLVSERLATLWQIRQRECDVVIAPVSTAMTRLAPVGYLLGRTFFLKAKTRLDADQLRADLVTAGYAHVTQVMAPGEFSIRGGLIDLFPMGSALPYRIDLFDDEIDSLRTFDPDSQRTLYPVPDIRLLPAREYPSDEAGITAFRQHYRERMEGDPSKSRIYRDVSAGMSPAGIEYFLPLFFDTTATLFDYLGEDALVVTHRDVAGAADTFWREVQERHQMARGDTERPVLAPAEIVLRPDELMAALKPYPRVECPAEPAPSGLPPLAVERRTDNPLQKLADFLAGHPGRVLLSAESLGRRETMYQFLSENGIKPVPVDNWAEFAGGAMKLALTVAPLFSGFAVAESQLAIITESELYQHVARSHTRRARARAGSDAMLRDLAEVKVGDPVVHEQHGIGRYLGLVSMDLGEGETELMQLEYADGAKLYVPVSQLQLISRYAGGATEQLTLHRLGSPAWDKAKKKAAEKARDTAAELLNLYAQRAAREGHAFSLNHHDYDAFAAGFGFEETPDQASAIEAVIADMCSGKPMDRLVCGDVGFGKTEVALRAAFVAVLGGKQVAVLVPTTLLAEQHFQNFSDRFADWPVKIAELSRFRSAKESKAALAGLAEGTVDIVIGTHKLVQPDVQFKNLGLVIIDEEHRFGVRQKEQLKRLRANVDVLTLTATPIPRTLSMALEGLRDFSAITTAPSRRLAVKTFISPLANGVIREAVLRELKRGGQVFFLHNEVDTIQNMQEKLAELLPEARIGVAHGQLRERELEQVMRDFLQQRFNLLLCSTIIETGIDIPNANTILINRADKFGLAQLHQLRGRVGRSHHQAYAYLLTPDGMTRDAQKRLEAIQLSEELGAGFYLAMHDLEIRGAGEVLGEGQSGEMQEVGFALFTEMLKQAVRDLKKGKTPDLDAPLGVTTEINLHSPALLPDAYCPDVHERLVLYKRLASCESEAEIDAIHEELIDRFGLPPQTVKTLVDSHRLRLAARRLGVQKLDASEAGIQLSFVKNPPIDPMKIITLIQSKKNYKLAGQDKLRVEVKVDDVGLRVVRVKELLKELQ